MICGRPTGARRLGWLEPIGVSGRQPALAEPCT
jgi:hypothetical protein